MKVSRKQLRRIIREERARLLREEKHVLASEEGGTEGYSKDVLSRSWGEEGEEADPKLDYVDESKWADIAGISLHEQADAGDAVLQKAMEIFGSDAHVDEEAGEVIIDVGDDQVVEDMYDQWIAVWPEGMHEEGGLIYTGVMV